MKSITSVIDSGLNGSLINIECRLTNSLPSIVIVGATGRIAAESKERIRGALAATGIKIPAKRIIINLAPADIPKSGSSFDLPMLVSLLTSASLTTYTPSKDTVLLGEVGLDGSIRPIRGIIGKIIAAKHHGVTQFWIPSANVAQASLVDNISISGFASVAELYKVLQSKQPPPISNQAPVSSLASHISSNAQYVVGQERAKRALVIAAAGGHHMLISGPPGTGKSLLARQLLPLLPAMSNHEILQTTQIHSLASNKYSNIIRLRPLRSPHHSASLRAIVGGARPGEISLSHNGVLLLDELAEFKKEVLESLREPLENRTINLASAAGSTQYPAHFLLIATTNPCPCGYLGHPTNRCVCSTQQITNYRRKLSGPILDRIDLYCETQPVHHDQLLTKPTDSNVDHTAAIHVVHSMQHKRSAKLNSQLSNTELVSIVKLEPPALTLLTNASSKMNLSVRAYMRTLKVARTIADLDNSSTTGSKHIAEALQYRQSGDGY